MAALGFSPEVAVWFFVLLAWTLVWKGVALWKSGRNNQIAWFVVMFLLNAAGILPIIYIFFFQKKTLVQKVKSKVKKAVKKK